TSPRLLQHEYHFLLFTIVSCCNTSYSHSQRLCTRVTGHSSDQWYKNGKSRYLFQRILKLVDQAGGEHTQKQQNNQPGKPFFAALNGESSGLSTSATAASLE